MAVEVEPTNRTGLAKYLPYPQLTALRLRDFRLWWISASTSMLNQFGVTLVLTWWVQEELDSPARVGTIILAFGLPSFLFVLPAGLLADRWDRKRQLVITQFMAVASASFLGLSFSLDIISFELGLLFAVISGMSVAFNQPARQALLPMLVPRSLLANGIVLGSLSMNASRVIAPAIVGVLMASAGLDIALYFVAFLMLIGAVTVIWMRIPHFDEDDGGQTGPTGSPRPASLREAFGGGFRFLIQNPPLLVLMALYMAGGLFVVGPMSTLVPVLVDQEWESDANAVGIAFTVQAISAFIAGLYLTRIGGLRNKGGFFALSMVIGTSSFAFFAASPWYALALVFFLSFGAASSVFINMSQSIIQSHTPRELMGRVMAIYQLAIQGLLPLGAFLAGLVAEFAGAPLTGLIGGLTAASLAALALIFARQFRQMS